MLLLVVWSGCRSSLRLLSSSCYWSRKDCPHWPATKRLQSVTIQPQTAVTAARRTSWNKESRWSSTSGASCCHRIYRTLINPSSNPRLSADHSSLQVVRELKLLLKFKIVYYVTCILFVLYLAQCSVLRHRTQVDLVLSLKRTLVNFFPSSLSVFFTEQQ